MLHVILMCDNVYVGHTMEMHKVSHIVHMATIVLKSMNGFVVLELLTKTLIDPIKILSF